MKTLPLLFLFSFVQWTCQSPADTTTTEYMYTGTSESDSTKMAGINFVAPPTPFSKNPMPAIEAVGINWIAVVPFAYTRLGEAKVRFDSDRQWWGERREGTIETVRLAKAAGFKVMIKPQVYIPGSWPGGLDFKTDKRWEAWEKDYEKYIMTFAAIADSMDVELFCVGTEFKFSEQKREQFWRQLIKKVRAQFKGKLVYASNWDSYMDVPFWDALDYIGIDAYFPLVDKKDPSIEEIKKEWHKYFKAIKKLHLKTNRPVLFTEYGYLSVDRCTYNNWELEKDLRRHPINEQAQANALDALHAIFWEEPFYHGGFIWKWFPNLEDSRRSRSRGYTPQGKIGEEVLKKWYLRE